MTVIGSWINAFVTALEARAALDGVSVSAAPPNPDLGDDEIVAVIGVAPSTDDPSSIGPQDLARVREENVTIDCAVWVRHRGSGDDIATEARDRAFTLFADIQTAMRSDPSMGVRVNGIDPITNLRWTWRLEQGINDSYRVAVIHFGVTVTARI